MLSNIFVMISQIDGKECYELVKKVDGDWKPIERFDDLDKAYEAYLKVLPGCIKLDLNEDCDET